MSLKQYIESYLNDFASNPNLFNGEESRDTLLVQNVNPVWNYEAGVTLMGALYMYQATNEKKYIDCIIKYMEYYILEDGTIRYLDLEERNLDKINKGKILFYLYEYTKDERYRVAIETLMDLLRKHPRTSIGNFWHKQIYPHQIWLDGVYMALPLYMDYENRFNKKENYNDIFNQVNNVRKYLYDDKTKLYFHAYDEKKVMKWADKETGLSHNFWLRSMGWYLMALVDLYELSSEEVFEQHKRYGELFKETLKGILLYQDEKTKLFYQLVNLPEVEGNYIETSGSAMIAYSIFKGCRLGLLSREKYYDLGKEMILALEKEKIVSENGKLHLIDICRSAGLGPGEERDGSIEYYLSEPIVRDELKGVGAVMMAYAEYLKVSKYDTTPCVRDSF